MRVLRIILFISLILPGVYTAIAGDTAKSALPLVIIRTDGQYIPDEPKIPVHMGIITGTQNSPSGPFNDYDGMAGIEIRGSSSQMFDKKGYGFETRNEEGGDTSVSVMGLPAESDWVLHGPYSDKSLVRNALAYYLFGAFGHYSPRTRFCELYIDNDYRGLYLLVEKIKRDKNRVNISKLKEEDIEGLPLTGGYIIKLDKSTGSQNTSGFSSKYWPNVGSDLPYFMIEYPDGDKILPPQISYISNKVNSFETALYGSDYKDPVNGYRGWIDVPSFIDYFIINELSKNVDGFRLSTFIYKDRDDKDPLFHAGPVWDYDLAFGNADYSNAETVNGWQYLTDGGSWPVPFWWEKLLHDKYYTSALQCRWQVLRQGLLSQEHVLAVIDSMIHVIGPAAGRNFTKYPILGTYVWPNPYIGYDYPSEVYHLKNWILDRLNWLDKFMPGVCVQSDMDNPVADDFRAAIFPNPSSGMIHLEVQNPDQKDLYLSLIDMSGRLIINRKIGKNPFITDDIPASQGIYQVMITDGKEYISLKAVVQ